MASDDPARHHDGPLLAFTTKYLRRGPRRMALRTKHISLPGTYQLSRVLGAAAGGVLGLVLSFPLATLTGMWLFAVIGATLGGGAGVFATTWSPLRGESLARWAMVTTAKRSGMVKIGGRWVRAYVGVAPLRRSPLGPTQVVATFTETAAITDVAFDGFRFAPPAAPAGQVDASDADSGTPAMPAILAVAMAAERHAEAHRQAPVAAGTPGR